MRALQQQVEAMAAKSGAHTRICELIAHLADPAFASESELIPLISHLADRAFAFESELPAHIEEPAFANESDVIAQHTDRAFAFESALIAQQTDRAFANESELITTPVVVRRATVGRPVVGDPDAATRYRGHGVIPSHI